MKRSDVYRFVLSGVVCAPLLAGAGILGLGLIPGTPAQAATDGVSLPQPDKPLGTLWYPGPYDPNATPPAPVKGPVLVPVQTPIPTPVPTPGATTFPAPAASGGWQEDKEEVKIMCSLTSPHYIQVGH